MSRSQEKGRQLQVAPKEVLRAVTLARPLPLGVVKQHDNTPLLDLLDMVQWVEQSSDGTIDDELDTKKRFRCLAGRSSKSRGLISFDEQNFGISNANLTGVPLFLTAPRSHLPPRLSTPQRWRTS